MYVVPNDSWLIRPQGEPLDGNIFRVNLQIRYEFPRHDMQKAERHWDMSTERAHGLIISNARNRLLNAAPNPIVQVNSRIRLHWLFTATTEVALEGSLDTDLLQSIQSIVNSLRTSKTSAGESVTKFTVADWNQVVHAAKMGYVAWFQQQKWHPWSRVYLRFNNSHIAVKRCEIIRAIRIFLSSSNLNKSHPSKIFQSLLDVRYINTKQAWPTWASPLYRGYGEHVFQAASGKAHQSGNAFAYSYYPHKEPQAEFQRGRSGR
jgi:hypothetical protein